MIRVLIVDDSAVVRKVLTKELSKFSEIEIVGTAIDPYVARDKIVQLQPDVITLDVEMPRMDGLTFLERLMHYHPIPVVIVSSVTPENSEAALRALTLGAIEVVCKPKTAFSIPDVSQQLVRAIRAASLAKLKKHLANVEIEPLKQVSHLTQVLATHSVLAIGASTGGTKAIEVVMRGLPRNTPGTVIVQHMPEHFTAPFATRLNNVCEMEVREARDNDVVVPGVALIAPGNQHLRLKRDGARFIVRLDGGEKVHHQRPSVDVLFESVAEHAGRNSVGVILTGMGGDGATGLKSMRERGAHTIAEHESSCIVYGMPKEAIDAGAAAQITPLPRMAHSILTALTQEKKPARSTASV